MSMDPTTPMGPGSTPLGAPGTAGPRDPEYGRYAGVGPGAGPGYDPSLHGHPQHHQQDGPGIGDRAQMAMSNVARAVKTPETKEFYKTSEFLVWVLTAAFILIAASVISGNSDHFRAPSAWLYVTIISAAYIVSRGISKSGTRRGDDRDRYDRGF